MNKVTLQKRALSFIPIFIVLFIWGCSEKELSDISDDLSTSSAVLPEGWHNSDMDNFDACHTERFCLVAGQYIDAGWVDVSYDNSGNLYISYQSEGGWALEELHLFVGHDAAGIPTNKNGSPKIGNFPLHQYFDEGITSYTVKIDNPHAGTEIQFGCAPMVIAAHAVVSTSDGQSETAWAQTCEDSESIFSTVRFVERGTWATYLAGELCTTPCDEDIDYSFAWEDLLNANNDTDYNDLVVQVVMWKSMEEGSIVTHFKFIAKARGAAYDHQFWISFDDSEHLIFESTKSFLNSEEDGFATNTVDPCDPKPFGEAEISFNEDIDISSLPFTPYIMVYPSRRVGIGSAYMLNIWELDPENGITFEKNGNTYPNGILIPNNWKWPLERTPVSEAYEQFMPIDSWSTTWFETLSDASKVWDPDNAGCDL